MTREKDDKAIKEKVDYLLFHSVTDHIRNGGYPAKLPSCNPDDRWFKETMEKYRYLYE